MHHTLLTDCFTNQTHDMKRFFTSLLAITGIIFLSLPLAAQNQSSLKDIHDASLPQLLKDKKDIRFVTIKGNHGAEIKWFTEDDRLQKPPMASPFTSGTANFHLTKDINTQTDADPLNNDFIFNKPYAVLNGIMYFSADDGVHGTELWRSDGTAAGTYLLKDVIAGSVSSNPHEITIAGSKIYFVTQNNTLFSYELWVSDGTAPGTIKLADFQRQGPGVNTAYNLTAVGSSVFYFTYGSFSEPVLWKTDGTIAGTAAVKDFVNISSGPLGHTASAGLFYFTLFSDATGRELYRSDGTEEGTFLVKDISSSTDYFTGPVQLTGFNGKLYFSDDDGNGYKLWVTDGTQAGTMLAKGSADVTVYNDFSYIFTNQPFAVQGNNLYMSALESTTGQELYRYNPVTGFSLVKNITPGAAGGYPYNIIPALGKIAFVYSDTLTKQTQLWATDGFNNTILIKSYDYNTSSFDNLTPGNGLLYFVSRTTESGEELWKTNGTAAGTTLVKDIYSGTTSSYPQDLTFVKGMLYFNAASKNAGTELWQSAGSESDTKMVTQINKASTSYSGPNFYNGIAFANTFMGATSAPAGKWLYFSATQPESGYELYKTDGTSAGTSLVKDIIPGESSSDPTTFLTRNGVVYFIASSVDSGYTYYSIYKADSTGNVVAITRLQNAYIFTYDVADNGWVYYIRLNNSTGKQELWRSDGTTAGELLLSDKAAGVNSNLALKTVGNTAYFTANDEAGVELWKSNGSVAGTKQVKDINAGSGSSNPYSLTVYKNNIYFGADDGSGIAFWRSNGTAAGTVKLKTIQPYGIYSNSYDYQNYFCVSNSILYLNAYTATTGYELWKTNGTPAGTVLVKDLTGDASDASPAYLTDVNGTVFFSALYDQLWKSDGTATGTVLIASISINDYSLLSSRCVADGKFFFNANQLLWVSDGTEAGTHVVSDNGLNGVSLINNITANGNTVFFNGYTDKYSYELYAGDASKVMSSIVVKNVNVPKKLASFSATVLRNPLGSTLKLNVKSDKEQTISITITNANGNIAAQQKILLYKGSSNITINAGNWQGGVYLVKLNNSIGELIEMRVFK